MWQRHTRENRIWAINFVHVRLSNGRSYKMLTILDEYICAALCVAVRPRMDANDVLDELHSLLMKYGRPEFIRSDNSPEFIAGHLQGGGVGIQPMQVYSGRTDIMNASTKHYDGRF